MIADWHARREELRARFPDWNIWYVPHVIGPGVWCCSPKRFPHHEDSADALGKWLEEQP